MADAATSEAEIAKQLRLRHPPAPVTRLSRKALITLGAVSSIAIAGAVASAMLQKPLSKGKAELFNTHGQHPPEAMAILPSGYGADRDATPKLGPPLPGDLGRPMVNAGQTLTSPLAGAVPAPAAAKETAPTRTPAQQQATQERDAARTSRLFMGGATPAAEPISVQGPAGIASAVSSPLPKEAIPGGQDSKTAVTDNPADQVASSRRLQAPASPYVIQAGAIIPAALVTGLRSDLTGQIIAQVTENVFDSPTGRFLLVPQGSKLIGTYESQVAFGQNRVLLAWTRLILPGGRSIVLDKDSGADAQGYSGLQDGVDHHWNQLFGAALLSTVLGVGAQAGANDANNGVVAALRQGTANSLNQVGQQVVGKSLNIPPTLTVRPGFPVRVIVARDLVLEPIAR